MIQEDAGSKPRSPSGERRNKKAMKIQPGQRSSPSSSSSPGRRGGQSEEESEKKSDIEVAGDSKLEPSGSKDEDDGHTTIPLLQLIQQLLR